MDRRIVGLGVVLALGGACAGDGVTPSEEGGAESTSGGDETTEPADSMSDTSGNATSGVDSTGGDTTDGDTTDGDTTDADTMEGESTDGGSAGTEDGSSDGTSDSTSGGESGSGSESTTGEALTCPDVDIGSAVPQVSTGDTSTLDDTLDPSCATGLANDATVAFTAPHDGVFIFDTIGSDFDTVLAMLDGCGGEESYCSDDLDGTETASRIWSYLEADQQVILAIDGNGEDGSWVLNVDEDPCPNEALPSSVPLIVAGSTTDSYDSVIDSCVYASAPDHAYSFVAPTAGTYVLGTHGSTYDTVLHVFDGDTCSGTVLACNDDTGGLQSQVFVDLAAGQEITIVVDGYDDSGDYTLTVDVLPGACPANDLGSTVPQSVMGDEGGSFELYFGIDDQPTYLDDTFAFTAPADGIYAFTATGPSLAASLTLIQGDCGTDYSYYAGDGDFTFGLTAGEEVVLAVTPYGTGSYTLDVAADPCPDADLGSTVPQTVMGSTVGASDSIYPGCFGTGADYSFLFTAPAAGTYTFDTEGSDFDTVLGITDGPSCLQPSLGCDDDAGSGTTSELSVDLTAGQQVVIHIDRGGASDGNFVLNIT